MNTKERTATTTLATTGEKLPPEWAKRLGIQPGETVSVTITTRPARRVRSGTPLREFVRRFQQHPLLDPSFSQDDLYDEQGLPK